MTFFELLAYDNFQLSSAGSIRGRVFERQVYSLLTLMTGTS